MRKKVTIVGAGNVGATTAQRIIEKDFADVVMIDILEGVPQGKALDMTEASTLMKHDSIIVGGNDYKLTEDSDIVVITAGVPRKPGMCRDDLLNTNADIIKKVVEQIMQYSSNTIIIVVSNPLDALCHVAYKVSGLPRSRIIGMAALLDSARFRAFIAMELGYSVSSVRGLVLGSHGDQMVPLVRYTTVAGIPLQQLLSEEKIEQLVQRTKNAGAEIVRLLKSGSAFYAPSAATSIMVESILSDKNKIIPCSVYLEGEYGISDLFVGVPVKLGDCGVKEIIEIELNDEERNSLMNSAKAVEELVNKLKKTGYL
ncbi:MAG: malate dehydrogenase [Spirochaetota bacterium]|nr:malate dehydrogenase [Spirochaetota bacterium]